MYTYIFIYVYTNREENRDRNGEREQDESGRQPSRVRRGIRKEGNRTDQNRGHPYPRGKKEGKGKNENRQDKGRKERRNDGNITEHSGYGGMNLKTRDDKTIAIMGE